MTTATFRVSTDILRRLGEELITSLDQGIVELVKNAYDADALNCTVEFKHTEKPGGTVVITDDGDGMSIEDIIDGWLVLGRSRKVPRDRTPLGRLPAGSKGLGRLAALRMGEEVLLLTRPRAEPGVEYSLRIRWSDFAQRDVVEDVGLDIQRHPSQQQPGTRIELHRLRDSVGLREAKRLARELLLLAAPFEDPVGFSPRLIASEFTRLEELVRRAYFDDSELRLVAKIDVKGYASAQILDRSGGVRWVTKQNDLDKHYRAPSAIFELWVFLLQASSFATSSATVGEVRDWLDEVGGVHLYHRGLRVRPYGDSGYDWLNMNLSRSRDPEFRPSTNTSLGRVVVLDEDEELLQKTDRSGFIENEAFRELRRFGIEALEWMQDKRLEERKERKDKEKQLTTERATRADANLKQTIGTLGASHKSAIQRAVREVQSARDAEQQQLREELGLYQTLASVGTAVSVFAHEIEGPATELTTSIKAIERRAQKLLIDSYESSLGNQINAAKRSSNLIARFATLPLSLLKRSKRRRTILDVSKTIEEVMLLFEPYLQDARIEITYQMTDQPAHIHGSVASIEAIISNLVTNAVKAFKRQGVQLLPRKLLVRTSVTEREVLVSVLDNGPGIPARLISRIWLPGVTSDENGTGLGLTIVRDTVTALGGRVEAIASGEFGGAELIVQLPRVRQES